MSQAPIKPGQVTNETAADLDQTNPVSGEANEDISRRHALKLGVAGLLAAGAGAIVTGARPQGAQAADGDPLKLGESNTASSDTKLIIDNADPYTTEQVDGLRVEVARGYSAIYGIAGSGAYGAVRAKNISSGPGLEAESADGPGITARAGTDATGVYAESISGYGVHGTSGSGPGVVGTGNATGPGVLAVNSAGGNALEVDGPAKFTGAVEFAGSTTKFAAPVEFQGGVQLGGLAGNAVIQRGKVSVTIANPAITNQSVILVTPVGNPGPALGGFGALLSASIWYERKPGQGFIIRLSLASKQDLEFSYFIAKL